MELYHYILRCWIHPNTHANCKQQMLIDELSEQLHWTIE